MAEFTVKLSDDAGVPATAVNTVGNQLEVMAGELAELIKTKADINRTGKDAVAAALKDYKTQRASGSWTEAAKTAADALLGSLSVKIWQDDEVVDEISLMDPNSLEKILDSTRLIFIFEEDGEMIIPVPTSKQIARGKQNAPLKYPSYHDALVSEGSVGLLSTELAASLEAAGDLSAEQIEAVQEALKAAGQKLRESVDPEPVFMSQLGDYSVRQCAS